MGAARGLVVAIFYFYLTDGSIRTRLKRAILVTLFAVLFVGTVLLTIFQII